MLNRAINRLADWLAHHRSLVWIGLILALAISLRLWQLHVIPPGLLTSEAELGNKAREVLAEGGSTDLFIYMQALLQLVFDQIPFSLRLLPAIIGVGSVAMVYILTKHWFSERVALLSSLFMAVSAWGLHITRLAEPATILLLLIPLHLWLWTKAIDTNKSKWYLAVGVSLGLFAYTNLPLWLVALTYIVVLAVFYRAYRHQVRHYIQPIIIVILSAIIAKLPLMLYMLVSGTTGPLQEVWSEFVGLYDLLLEPMQLLTAAVATLGMFHFSGSPEPAYNAPMLPHLDAVVGILLIFGILIAVRDRKQIRYTLLIVLLPIMLLPAIFSSNTPDPVSSIIALPFMAILAAVGMSELITRWHTIFPRNVIAKQFGAFIIVSALALSSYYNFQHYFVAWANTPEVITEFNEEATMAANYVNASEGEGAVVIEADDQPLYEFLIDDDAVLINVDDVDVNDFEEVDYVIDMTFTLKGQFNDRFETEAIDSNLISSQTVFYLFTATPE